VYEFLAPVNPPAAARVVRRIATSVNRLAESPRIGQRLAGFSECEVRRILVGRYELRYEIRKADLFVLRLFHAREDRPSGRSK
jgi:plasmid stabilization system protein ParE